MHINTKGVSPREGRRRRGRSCRRLMNNQRTQILKRHSRWCGRKHPCVFVWFFFFCRRSYVGVELVQWLCEQCVYVRCRTTAVRVWQVLLELGVLLSGNKNISIIKRSLSPKKTWDKAVHQVNSSTQEREINGRARSPVHLTLILFKDDVTLLRSSLREVVSL